MNKPTINYQNQIRIWERWREFQAWQGATTMQLLFGPDYLLRPPSLPKEFEEYAKHFVLQEILAIGKEQNYDLAVASADRFVEETKKI